MLAALLFVAAAMALVAVLLFAVVVAGIRQEPANAEMTSRAQRPTAALARLLLGVYVRRPYPAEDTDRASMLLSGRPGLGRGRPMTHPAGWTAAEPCPSCGSWDITEYEIRVGSSRDPDGLGVPRLRPPRHLDDPGQHDAQPGQRAAAALGHAPARHHHHVWRAGATGAVRTGDGPAHRPGSPAAGDAGIAARGPAARLRSPSARAVRQPSAPRGSPDHGPLQRPGARHDLRRSAPRLRRGPRRRICPRPGGRVRSRCWPRPTGSGSRNSWPR